MYLAKGEFSNAHAWLEVMTGITLFLWGIGMLLHSSPASPTHGLVDLFGLWLVVGLPIGLCWMQFTVITAGTLEQRATFALFAMAFWLALAAYYFTETAAAHAAYVYIGMATQEWLVSLLIRDRLGSSEDSESGERNRSVAFVAPGGSARDLRLVRTAGGEVRPPSAEVARDEG